jgi:hypothetical protein
MSINRYGRKVQGESCEDHLYPKEYWETPILDHMITSSVPSSRDLRRSESVRPAKLNTRSAVALAAGIARN